MSVLKCGSGQLAQKNESFYLWQIVRKKRISCSGNSRYVGQNECVCWQLNQQHNKWNDNYRKDYPAV